MKLLVQARKDGYNVLYPKPTPTEFFQFAGDIRGIDNNSGNFLGKYIYSIALASGGCIFTKHVIVQDVQREGLGNVGFSVFIPNVKKLPGVYVKSLLDELQKAYCENYCPDYYLINKQEDWTIFEEIANQYESRLQNQSAIDFKDYQQGTGEAAFIYYSDDSELQKYFDAPHQKEYRTYKQVFFVEKRLIDVPENPLNTLKHNSFADLTEKIDLSKPIALKITAIDSKNGDLIHNFKLRRMNDPTFSQEKDTELIFKHGDINKQWTITIEHSDYETFYFQFNPANDPPNQERELTKIQSVEVANQFGNPQHGKVYRLTFDKNKGRGTSNGMQIPDYVYKTPVFKLDAQPGYEFERWELKNPKYGDNYYFEAVFIKSRLRNISKWIWILLVILLIAMSSAFVIYKMAAHSGDEEQEKLQKLSSRINLHVQGIELNKDTLEKFKSSYCNPVSTTGSNISNEKWWQKIWSFRSRGDKAQSHRSDSLPDFCSRIDNALRIRMAIIDGKIDLLKSSEVTYSEEQQDFKMAIDSINTNFKKQLRDTLTNSPVRTMSLDKIATRILKIQKELKKQEQIKQDSIEQQKVINLDNLQREKLKKRNSLLAQQKALENDFWYLVNSGNAHKERYDNLLRKYRRIDSDIVAYLIKISTTDEFKKFKDIPEKDRRKASSLNDIEIINQ